jgi:hypothetical protein
VRFVLRGRPRSTRPSCRERSGQCPGYPEDILVRAGDDLQVHTVLLMLAEVEGPVGGDPVDRDQRSVQDRVSPAGLFASRTARRSPGARAASSATVSLIYRQAVVVPTRILAMWLVPMQLEAVSRT